MFETTQAKLVFTFSAIMLALGTIAVYTATKNHDVRSVYVIINVLVGLAVALLLTYDINCLVVGNCNVWSWIRTVLYLITVISYIAIIILILVHETPKEKKEEKTAAAPATSTVPAVKA